MTDPTQFKSVGVDLRTYNLLMREADEQCRTISGQIKFLVKKHLEGANEDEVRALPAPTPAAPPVAVVKPARRPSFSRIIATGAAADMLVRFYQTEATLSSKDFTDLPVEDPSGALYNLGARGDLKRIGNTKPFFYQITPQGKTRARKIIEARRNKNGS